MEQKPMQVPPRIKPPPPRPPQRPNIPGGQQMAKAPNSATNVPNSLNFRKEKNIEPVSASQEATKIEVEQKLNITTPETEVLQEVENIKTLSEKENLQQELEHETASTEQNLENALQDNKPVLNKEKIKKEKTPKVKKEKKPKEQISKKLKFLLISICTSFILAIGCFSSVFILSDLRTPKLATPTIKVVQLFNGTVLQASLIEEATGYEFEITNHLNKTSTYKTSTNKLQLSTYLSQGGEYAVRVRALGESKRATSNYCEKLTFTNYVRLKTPKIYLNNLTEDAANNLYKSNEPVSQTDDTITWESVANADKYLIRYGVDLENDLILSEEIISYEGTMTFNLSKIYAKGSGVYQISVVAVPADDTYYLQSDYEKIVTVEYYAKQTKPTGASFNKQTKEFAFNIPIGTNYGNEFDLHISYNSNKPDTVHRIYLTQCTTKTNLGRLYASLTLSQVNVSEISSMALVTLADSNYSTDSDATLVTIV